MKKILLTIATAMMAIGAYAAQPSDVHIYINPGHGGHDSDDRNVVIEPFSSGDPNGYWESNSNLAKGLDMRDILQSRGFKVTMSRVTNTSDDDLGLETIGYLANNSGADIFLAIHSNATGTASRVNYPIGLYRGYTGKPQVAKSDVLANMLQPYLLSNQATVWTNPGPYTYGDWTFYPSWGTQGLGVLRVLTIPGMLSEGSFHDYIPETYRLMNNDFCWLEAWHFVKMIDQYFSIPKYSVGNLAGCITDSRILRDKDYIMYGRDKLNPLMGAKVTLQNSDSTVVATYTTDSLYNGYYIFKMMTPGKYRIKVNANDHYNVAQDVQIVADTTMYANIGMNRIRNTAPEVVSYSPVWNDGDSAVLCNIPITMTFNWDMDTESAEKAFTITPSVKGTFTWEDTNYKMVFTPDEPYQANTKYTVTLAKSAMHGGGTPMKNDVTFSFTTDSRRFLDVIGQFPNDGENVHYSGAAIDIRCDRPINATPIFSQITLTDSAGNEVAFNKRGMTNNKTTGSYGFIRLPILSKLTVGATYTLSFDGAIADYNGIKLENPIVAKFKAVDASAAKNGTVVANFEDATQYTLNTSESANYKSAVVSNNTTYKLFDSKSMLLNYTFTGTSDGVISYNTSAPTETFTSNDYLGAHIYGDVNGNKVVAELSADEEKVLVPICDVTFDGWKYVTAPLTSLTANKAYKLTGIRLIQTASPMSTTGKIYFDNFIKSNTGGVNKVAVSGLKVFPSPAASVISVTADKKVEGLQLIGNNGVVVAQSDASSINVEGVANGAYLLRIKVADGFAISKVVVAHK
jgi:hypothetical protein